MTSDIYTDHAIIDWVLDHCKILHLGLVSGDCSYVVPVNYGYDEDAQGHYSIFVHGTVHGQKGQALNKEPIIGFETDGGHEGLTYTPPATGAFGPAYRSVMGTGQVYQIADNQEKLFALRKIVHHYVRDIPAVIHADDLTNVPVWKIDVQKISAKVHHPTVAWQRVMGINEPIASGYHYDSNGDLTSVDNINSPKTKKQPHDLATDTGASASIKSDK